MLTGYWQFLNRVQHVSCINFIQLNGSERMLFWSLCIAFIWRSARNDFPWANHSPSAWGFCGPPRASCGQYHVCLWIPHLCTWAALSSKIHLSWSTTRRSLIAIEKLKSESKIKVLLITSTKVSTKVREQTLFLFYFADWILVLRWFWLPQVNIRLVEWLSH